MKSPRIAFLQILAVMIVVCALPCALNAQSFLYTNDNIANNANTVTAFSVGSTGALTQIGSYPTGGMGDGGGLYASNRVRIGTVGNFLYVTDDGSNDVAGFSINPSTGALTTVPGSPFATGGIAGPPPSGGISLAATPDGKFLIAGNAGSANFSVFSIAANGALTLVTNSPFAAGGSPDGMRLTPNGAFLTVGLVGPVGVYSAISGGIPTAVPGSPFAGSGTDAGVDVSCAGNRSFAGNFGNTTVIDVFNLALNGSLSPIPGSPFTTPAANSNVVLLSPNNQFLFVSNQDGDSITVFSVASNGSLAQVTGSPFGVNSGGRPSLIATDQAGAFLFTANYPQGEAGASVGAFSIAANGALTPVTGSPFPVQGSDVESIAVFPPPTCGNPVPLINQPLTPDATPPGGPDFTLTVNGNGFVTTSLVNWNNSALATTFVTRNQLTAIVPSSNIATSGTATVTVNNPAPGGGTSRVALFSVTNQTPAVTFAGQTAPVGAAPFNVVVADFNRDGKPDLAVVNNTDPSCQTPGTVTVLLGNGDGTFTPKQSPTAVGCAPVSAAVGDFNGDGKPDVAVVNNCPSGCSDGSTVSILLGNGDGTFTTGSDVFAGSTPTDAIAADFNGDGKVDLAVSSNGGNSVYVYLGNGDGTFNFGSPLQVSTPTSLATGDFNGDGILDLAIATGPTSPGVMIFLGNGDGSFAPAASQPITNLVNAVSLTTGDFNGDSVLDLAFADVGSGILTVLQGNGDGTFNQVSGEPVSSQYSTFLRTADFNGDNKLDLAVVGFCGGLSNCSPLISLYLGNGDGTFQGGLNTAAGSLPLGLAFGDFNGDGRLDLAVANSKDNSVSVLLQSPAASLTPPVLAFGNQPVSTTSNPQLATLTNTGSATLNITGISIIGSNSTDFAENGNCGTVLTAGANCTIDVTFTPTASGQRNAMLAVYDNAAGSPQTVNLSGTGVQGPVIQIQPASQTINYGQTAMLSVTAIGTPPLSYQWYQGISPNGNAIPGATNSSYTTPALTATADYWVQVSNAAGKANSTTAIVTVNSLLTITTTSLPGGTVGVPYSQTLQATGGAQPYAWSITVGSLPAGLALNTSSGVISGIPTTVETSSFTVQVTDANSNRATQPLSIQIVSLPPMITTQPASQTINYGQTATLSVVAVGTPPLSYQWFEPQSGGQPTQIPEANSSTYTTPSLDVQTSYWVVVTDSAGSVQSSTATISINAQSPKCMVNTIQATSTEEITLVATCTDPQGSALPGSIDWGDGTQTPLTDGTNINETHTYSVTGLCQIVISVQDAEKLSGSALTLAYVGNVVKQVSTTAGGSANASLPVQAPPGLASPVQVVFNCVSVTQGTTGTPVAIGSFGITCDPSKATLTPNQQTNVSLTVHSSGVQAALRGTAAAGSGWRLTTWLLMPGLVIAGSGLRTRSGGRRGAHFLALGIVILLIGLWVACGGGASLPNSPQGPQTPPGKYQVTATSSTTGSTPTGFQQTTVIVPFNVQ